MYVTHVTLGMSMPEVGRGFARDRTTVRHACHLIEDMRDDVDFDRAIADGRTGGACGVRDGWRSDMEGPAATDKSVASAACAACAAARPSFSRRPEAALLLVKNEKGAISVEAKLLAVWQRADRSYGAAIASRRRSRPEGRMRNSGSRTAFEHRHREIESRVTIDDGMGTSVVAGINWRNRRSAS